MNTPLAVRNNNPCNIRVQHRGQTPWEGETGQNEGFCVFSDAKFGFRAVRKLFKVYAGRGMVTARQIITEWAPPTENDTEAYIKDVCGRSQVGPDEKVVQWPAFIKAMSTHEAGGWFFTDDELVEGIALA